MLPTRFLAALCFVIFPAALAAAEQKPNILFLITDDQFKTMMNFYPEGKGKNLTPHTDTLAAEATVMMRQYVTSPVCTPSRYGCLTGSYPSRSQSKKFHTSTREADGQTVVQWNTFITEEKNTLPRRLKDAGYFTGMVGKNHVFECDGMQKPKWDADPLHAETKELLAKNRDTQIAGAKAIGFDFAASLYYNNPVENGIKALAAHNLDWIAQGAMQFLDQATTEKKPFFLYLATTVPHGPQAPNQSWNGDRRITADGMLDKPLDILPPASSYEQRLQAAGIKAAKNPQRQNILWLDDMVGAVMDRLKKNGQFENTIIIYFNDHGQAAKGTVYEGGVHGESFVWRKGGFPAGGQSAVPVSNIDFTPTLLDLAGVEFKAAEFDGRSFAPILLGKETKRDEPLFFELGYARGVLHREWKYIALRYPAAATSMSRAERQRRLDEFNEEQKRKGRPVHTTDATQPFSHVSLIPGGGDAEHESIDKYPAFHDADQLYQLEVDATEQKNLARDPAHAAKLAEMKSLLQSHLSKMPGTFAELTTSKK